MLYTHPEHSYNVLIEIHKHSTTAQKTLPFDPQVVEGFLRRLPSQSTRMADPVGLASGLVALTTFALQSSKTLYQATESFKSNRKAIRDLREELEALDGVLQSLTETATGNETHLDTLKLPLLRCGIACKDFEAVIIKCTAHSDGSKTSFRDWAKLTYMGEDIIGFRNMLAGYKSTIGIALGDANM